MDSSRSVSCPNRKPYRGSKARRSHTVTFSVLIQHLESTVNTVIVIFTVISQRVNSRPKVYGQHCDFIFTVSSPSVELSLWNGLYRAS